MKIKNYIKIKANGKCFDFHNLILDEYLKKFVNGQLDFESFATVLGRRKLIYCFLKFDEPLIFQPDSIISNTEFDICLVYGIKKYEESISDKMITEKYNYSLQNDSVWDYNGNNWNADISEYYNRKITAIGFNTSFSTGSIYTPPICSILNTANYNISLQKNEIFELTRIDKILSDAIFWSSDKRIKGPIHLCTEGGPSLIYQDPLIEEDSNNIIYSVEPQKTYAKLYSVGLSYTMNNVDKELIIGQDINFTNFGTYIEIDGIKEKISKYSYSPLNTIFPNNNLFPLRKNYKYIIFIYKIY